MTSANETARYCADLVAGLADAGVDAVFISPGSRNTALTLAFAAEPRVRDISIRDERSAGFAALGHGKATGRPAAVVCTSGSAATHYFPAVVEADQSAAPLIVLTADRPARLRGTGAPQTMDQIDLYGTHVKAFADLDIGSATGRRDGHRLVETAVMLPAGAVHANVPLDEPLLGDTRPKPSTPNVWDAPTPHRTTSGGLLDALAGRNVLIVAGGRQQPDFRDAVNQVAHPLGAPVIADPQCWVTGPNTVRNGDLLATSSGAFDSAAPDVVLRLGPLPTSKALWTWLERSGVEQILVDRSRLTDPLTSAATVVDADPTAFLLDNIPEPTASRTFVDVWLGLEAVVHGAASKALAALPFPNEPEIARTLAAGVQAGSCLYIASSMPIRDIDTFADPREDITVLANRGVNGIDGTISSALGAALSGVPTTLLVGDVAALHDATAMSEVAGTGAPLRIVIVNNDGAGIFSFLPQAASDLVSAATFEKHWGTPHGLTLASIASSMGLAAETIDDADTFIDAVARPIDGSGLIELHTDREANVAHHHAIRAAVSSAITP